MCSFFHVLFSGVLFALIKKESSNFSKLISLISFIRLVSLLSFSYITAVDDINSFNNSYVLYLLSNFAWIYFIQTRVKSKSAHINGLRRQIKLTYVVCLVLASFFFYKHQVLNTNFAYSISSLFQWVLIGLDIFFDQLFEQELRIMSIEIDFPEGNLKRHIV